MINKDNTPITNYLENNDYDTLNRLFKKAQHFEFNSIDISNSINEIFDSVRFFVIENSEYSYTIYEIDNVIYYRDSESFFQIYQDLKDEVPGTTIDSFKYRYDDVTEEINGYSNDQVDDCIDILNSIISSLTVIKEEDEHNVIVKKDNGLSTDYDIKKSVLYNEAKYKTKEQKEFEEEIEKEQLLKEVPGVLDQAQQESTSFDYNKALELLEANKKEIYYEPNDRVIVDDEYATVTDVEEDSEGNQIISVMKGNGEVIQIEPSKVKPDPEQLKSLIDLEPKD